MVDEPELQQVRGLVNAAGESAVGLARRGVAGRMVVREHEPEGRMNQRRSQDLARVRDAFRKRADGHDFRPNEAMARVYEQHEQPLAVERGALRREQLVDRLRAVDARLLARTPGQPAANLEDGSEFRRLGGTNALRAVRNLPHRGAGERVQAAPGAQNLAGHVDHVALGRAGAQKNRDQLGVAQARRAALGKLLARPVGLGEFADAGRWHRRANYPPRAGPGKRKCRIFA